MASLTAPKTLNPYLMMQDLQAWINSHHLLVAIIAILLFIFAAYLLYEILKEFLGEPKRTRVIRIGKTDLFRMIKDEIVNNMKKKKR
jgi:flagellar biogenesis protein FliO